MQLTADIRGGDRLVARHCGRHMPRLAEACPKYGITTPRRGWRPSWRKVARVRRLHAHGGEPGTTRRRAAGRLAAASPRGPRAWRATPSIHRWSTSTAAAGERPGRLGRWLEIRGRGLDPVTGPGEHEAVRDPLASQCVLTCWPCPRCWPSRSGPLSACAYWADHHPNELADAGQFDAITRRINGGTTGLGGSAREVRAGETGPDVSPKSTALHPVRGAGAGHPPRRYSPAPRWRRTAGCGDRRGRLAGTLFCTVIFALLAGLERAGEPDRPFGFWPERGSRCSARGPAIRVGVLMRETVLREHPSRAPKRPSTRTSRLECTTSACGWMTSLGLTHRGSDR